MTVYQLKKFYALNTFGESKAVLVRYILINNRKL